jgi:hypothetical protein
MKERKPVRPGPKMNIAKSLPDSSGTLNRGVQDAIGKQLRAMYEDLVNQAVPDRFTELLQKLDKRHHKAEP